LAGEWFDVSDEGEVFFALPPLLCVIRRVEVQRKKSKALTLSGLPLIDNILVTSRVYGTSLRIHFASCGY
jgi:hypothetical protein